MQAEEDRNKKSVQVRGATLEDALQQASVELGLSIDEIDYEVLVKGSKGFMGMGKADWVLIAYKMVTSETPANFEEDMGLSLEVQEEEETSKDVDGAACVRLTPDGVMLKITPPQGNGKQVTEKEATHKVKTRDIHDFEKDILQQAVKNQDDEYIRIGDYHYNPANDSIMSVDIADYEMKAYITISPPGKGGTDLSADNIQDFLKNNGVEYGVKEELVEQLEDNPEYNEPILIAEGKQPENGKDAKIIYNFETDTSKVRLKEKDGKVDFKELNIVQNVVEGQILAKKIPYEKGTPGKTVTGKMLPAKNGHDIEIGIGKNVKLTEDGIKAVATINGQVTLANNKINVEPVYVVDGNVDLHTGNILFLGTVMVKGSVDDGFSVKAAGNIEIMGNVGKSNLDAEGDIVVHQGVLGKTAGTVKCGRSLWAKFIENAQINATDFVIVSDGIINSEVDANKKIICQGKRATIVGGHLRASEEINAKTLGSVAGAETLLEVGYDPTSKERYSELEQKKEEIEKDLDEINLNIKTLDNQKKREKKLPKEKQKNYKQLQKRKYEQQGELKKVDEEMEEIQNYLASLKTNGKISASGTVYPGVRITIKEAVLDVRNEQKNVTYINEGNIVKATKYEEVTDDITRKK